MKRIIMTVLLLTGLSAVAAADSFTSDKIQAYAGEWVETSWSSNKGRCSYTTTAYYQRQKPRVYSRPVDPEGSTRHFMMNDGDLKLELHCAGFKKSITVILLRSR